VVPIGPYLSPCWGKGKDPVDDLLITLAPGSPEIPRSAWGFTIACTAAEAALKKLDQHPHPHRHHGSNSCQVSRRLGVLVHHHQHQPEGVLSPGLARGRSHQNQQLTRKGGSKRNG
jgi:hypothetical protein